MMKKRAILEDRKENSTVKKNLRTLLAALLALILILSATAALASEPDSISGGPIGQLIINPSSDNNNPGSGPSEKTGAAYLSIPMSGEGVGELKFVSTRKCLVVKDGYREYFGFRVEDGKLIFTNADGVDTEVAVGEDGRGALELALANGETFTADIAKTTLSSIIHNGVFPIEENVEEIKEEK